MKLEFEKVDVTGYKDSMFFTAQVGDTTILLMKDYTGEVALCAFKPELVTNDAASLDHEIIADAFDKAASAMVPIQPAPKGFEDLNPTPPGYMFVEPLKEDLPDVKDMRKRNVIDELRNRGVAEASWTGLRVSQARKLLEMVRLDQTEND